MSAQSERCDRLREAIARDETDLRSALRNLGRVSKRAIDPLNRVAGHEWILLSGAFALGYWLGRPERSHSMKRR